MRALSVVIMTLNEAANIERCIGSVYDLADEVVVVDSGSTDDTVARAEAMGARVVHHPFRNYTEQRRFCIAQATHDLVLALDADEWVSPELSDAIRQAKQEHHIPCYRFNRLNSIGGQWIRHGSWYPEYLIRLFDRRFIQQADTETHDKIRPAAGAAVGRLPGYLYHLTSADITERITTINHLSDLAARELYRKGKRGHWGRLIFKPAFRFFQEYVLQRGFLDGFYGYVIARSSAQYVFLRESKLMEMGRVKEEGRSAVKP